jgi:hypothetical protein
MIFKYGLRRVVCNWLVPVLADPSNCECSYLQSLCSSSLPACCLRRTLLDAQVRTQADNYTEGKTLCFRLSEACPTLDDLSIDGDGLLR